MSTRRATMAARSLAWLRRAGYQVGKVGDHWNPYAPRGDGGRGVLQDLWGFADALLCGPARGIGLVNWCSGSRHAEHRVGVLANPKALGWLLSGGKIWILSWSKAGPRGARKVWTPRLEEIAAADFEREVPGPVEETLPDQIRS